VFFTKPNIVASAATLGFATLNPTYKDPLSPLCRNMRGFMVDYTVTGSRGQAAG